MRGARAPINVRNVAQRIIPADAGSTHRHACTGGSREDHPRGCGEHKTVSSTSRGEAGSSPRMRGALTLGQQGCLEHRIIPADAGSTIANVIDPTAGKDHPRGCGEHDSLSAPVVYSAGSSPRMRGAHPRRPAQRRQGRIIPADAGSTYMNISTENSYEDHPRGCGEHWSIDNMRLVCQGSSPRMRGALREPSRRHHEIRIIPADAGSTSHLQSVCRQPPDHPRGCGEH